MAIILSFHKLFFLIFNSDTQKIFHKDLRIFTFYSSNFFCYLFLEEYIIILDTAMVFY